MSDEYEFGPIPDAQPDDPRSFAHRYDQPPEKRSAEQVAADHRIPNAPGWFKTPTGAVNIRAAFAVTTQLKPGAGYAVIVQPPAGPAIDFGTYAEPYFATSVAKAVVALAFEG